MNNNSNEKNILYSNSSNSFKTYNSDSSDSSDNSNSSSKSSVAGNKTLGDEFKGKFFINTLNSSMKNIGNNEPFVYIIINKIGYGSFSSVWIGYSLYDKKLIAVKICHPLDYNDSCSEVNIFEKINSHNINKNHILTMLNYFEVNNIIDLPEYRDNNNYINKHKIIVLPLLACSSYDLLKIDEYEDGLPSNIIFKITKQLINSIIELEKIDIIHTDLKPENILIEGLTKKHKYILKLIDDYKIDDVLPNGIYLSDNYSDDKDNYLSELKNRTNNLIIELDSNIDNKEYSNDILPEYLENINIKICDYNLCKIFSDYQGKNIEIQTRYYRAPEIIMGIELHKKTDYWSIGCIIFELLTGDMLFDPEKDGDISTDIAHLYLIIELLGPIPNNIIDKCSYNFFDGYKLNKIKNKIKLWPLESVLKDNYSINIKKKSVNKLINIINGLLRINPEKRDNLSDILKKYF